MMVELDHTGTLDGLQAALERVLQHPEVRGLQILASINNPWSAAELETALKQLPVPAFGGLFTGVIYEGQAYDVGTVVVGLPTEDTGTDFKAALASALPEGCPGRTAFVYVDCTASAVENFLAALFEHCGPECTYIGGGAGALDFVPRPCVLTHEGLFQGSGVLAVTDMTCSVGVSHGWRSLAGPFLITEASGHVVKTLNWRPAFEVYREVVEAHSKKSFDEMPFYDLSKFYPFVLGRVGTEGVVRDPVNSNPDGSLLCVGDMPVNSLVDIVTGTPHSMIRAATRAATTAVEGFAGERADGITLLMECISRSLCLAESLPRELEAVRVPGLPQVGVLTIGEIASRDRNYLEFFNKTTVVGVLAP